MFFSVLFKGFVEALASMLKNAEGTLNDGAHFGRVVEDALEKNPHTFTDRDNLGYFDCAIDLIGGF